LFKKELAQLEATSDPAKKAARVAELAHHLTRVQLDKVISLAKREEDSVAALILKALAPQIAPKLGFRALFAANLIVDLNIRTEVLKALEPYWKEDDRSTVLTEAVTQHLSPEELSAELATTNLIENKSDRALAYGKLGPKLNNQQLSELLFEILKIEDERTRNVIVRGPLIEHFGKRLPGEILAAVETFQHEENRASVIWSLSRVLPKEYLKGLLAAADDIKTDRLRALIFLEGAANDILMREEPERTIALAMSIKEDAYRGWALLGIAANNPPHRFVPEIMNAVSTLNQEDMRGAILAWLSTIWTEEQRINALDMLSKISDKRELATFFAEWGRPIAKVAQGDVVARASESIEQDIIPDKVAGLGSRGQKKKVHNTRRRTEGHVQHELEIISPQEGLDGLKAFLRALGVPNKRIDDSIVGQAALLAAIARVEGRPKWDDKDQLEDLKDLNAPRFLRHVYGDLISGDLRLPDGRVIWHLSLPNGHPVWQEAIRSYDSKLVQVVQSYINERQKNSKGLADAKGLVFGKKDARGRPKKWKLKQKHRGAEPR
jgi:hypothetical protein